MLPGVESLAWMMATLSNWVPVESSKYKNSRNPDYFCGDDFKSKGFAWDSKFHDLQALCSSVSFLDSLPQLYYLLQSCRLIFIATL